VTWASSRKLSNGHLVHLDAECSDLGSSISCPLLNEFNYYPQQSPPDVEAKLGDTPVVLQGQLTNNCLRLVGQGAQDVGGGVRIEYRTLFYGQGMIKLEAFQPRDI
jgi:hypothetical protein